MEFLEYYQIIRSRIWLALAMAGAALAVVVVYQVLPPSQRQTEVNLEVDPISAGRYIAWQGKEIGFVSDRDYWGTIEQFTELPATAEQAALAAGVGLPVSPFKFERGKRGNIFTLTATGRSAQAAERLGAAGAEYISWYWDEHRVAQIRTARRQLETDVKDLNQQIAVERVALDAAQKGELPGKPTDLLTWVQGQVTSLQGSMSAAEVEVGVAQDRLTALNSLARREAALPPDQRTLGRETGGLSASLQARIVDLETERLQMLNNRTPSHPDVMALDREIKQTKDRLAQETRSNPAGAAAQGSTAVQEQIMMAELDLRAAQRRIEALRSQDVTLRQRIPRLQMQARDFEERERKLNLLISQRQIVVTSLNTLKGEETRLEGTNDVDAPETRDAQGNATRKIAANLVPSPKTLSTFLMMATAATLAGFIMGCVLIFVLHYVDLTFKNEAEAEQLLGYSVLAAIPRSDIIIVPAPAPADNAPNGAPTKDESGNRG